MTMTIHRGTPIIYDFDLYYTLEQLKAGAKSSGGTPVVYLDRKDAAPRLFSLPAEGEEILLKSYAEENSADAATLHRVINETRELAPSDQFVLVLWSHAMGWVPAITSGILEGKLSQVETLDVSELQAYHHTSSVPQDTWKGNTEYIYYFTLAWSSVY